MKFFNPQEDVLDIQLTQFGKRLLAQGKMQPVYYAFFDDDILYDGAAGGITESQNGAEERIKTKTPRLHTQYVFRGIEANLRDSDFNNTAGMNIQIKTQNLSEKEYALGVPLGNCALSGNYAPAWDVQYLFGELDTSENYITGAGGRNLNIPQLNSTIAFETYVTQYNAQGNLIENPLADKQTFPNDGDWDPLLGDLEENLEFDDGGTIQIKDDGLILSILEKNTDFLTENFDIEVFVEETQNSKTVLKQLYFSGELGTDDPDTVEYYFDIMTDEQVPNTILCQLPEKHEFSKKQNALSDKIIVCDDTQQDATGDTSPKDIYDIDPEDPGDVC
jgi:hypothetical protein